MTKNNPKKQFCVIKKTTKMLANPLLHSNSMILNNFKSRPGYSPQTHIHIEFPYLSLSKMTSFMTNKFLVKKVKPTKFS